MDAHKDPDPKKIGPDPQHCYRLSNLETAKIGTVASMKRIVKLCYHQNRWYFKHLLM